MANELGLRSYVGFQQQAISDEYLSNQAPRCFQAELQQRVIQNATGSVQANSRLVFAIPSGENSYIKPGSAYISVTVTITNTNAANVATFRKSRLGNAIFRACQLTANGVLVERRENTNDTSALLYLHASNANFYQNDASVLEGVSFDAGATSTLQLYLPVPLGCFNAQAIPMWALPSTNVLLECELDSITSMFSCSAGSVSAVTFANAQLIYESLQVDASMVAMLKEEMTASQIPYVIPIQECRVFVQAGAASANVVLGLNLSSVDAVMVGQRANPLNDQALELYAGPAEPSRFDLYCDGRKVNQENRLTGLSMYPALSQSLSKIYDITCSSHNFGATMSRANYISSVFFAGQNLRKTNNKSVVLCGRPCNTINVDLQGFSANNVLIYVFHSSLWQIDVASGSVTMLR